MHAVGHLTTQTLLTVVPGIGTVIHIKVMRHDGLDGITWDELQAIKDELGFDEQAAIEVYPPRNEIVYECNMRHLWILPPGFPLPSLL